MNDPWMPDWSEAPEWAKWHSVDDDGTGWWYEDCPIVETWWDEDAEGNDFERQTWKGDTWIQNDRWLEDIDGENTKGLDWRNSLRHRPEVKP